MEEVERFLNPIQQNVPVEHVGWSNFDPVFKPVQNATVTEVRAALQSLLDGNGLRSAGHRAYVLEPAANAAKPTPANTAILLKVEDWMTGCIPNTHHDDASKREAEISHREHAWLNGRGSVVVKYLGGKPRYNAGSLASFLCRQTRE